MMKGTVLVISSDPTGNCLNGTRGTRQDVISLEDSRACAKEMKNDESSTANYPKGAQNTKRQSMLEWYFVLRTHYRWTIFQAIRYALWLAR
jgi:hypothetical protein